MNTLLAIEKESLGEPENYKNIFSMSDKSVRLKTIDEELNNMKIMNAYTNTNKVLNNANDISTRWILKYMKNSEGVITKR